MEDTAARPPIQQPADEASVSDITPYYDGRELRHVHAGERCFLQRRHVVSSHPGAVRDRTLRIFRHAYRHA